MGRNLPKPNCTCVLPEVRPKAHAEIAEQARQQDNAGSVHLTSPLASHLPVQKRRTFLDQNGLDKSKNGKSNRQAAVVLPELPSYHITN